jgi:FdrA protein
VILLDVVLGYGAHVNPARALVPVIREARARARTAGRWLCVVASVCGTEDDPQGYDDQVAQLIDAGVLVQSSNAQAAHLAGLIAQAAGASGHARPQAGIPPIGIPPVGIPPAGIPPSEAAPQAADAATLPPAQEIIRLLAGPVRVVNVGLGLFAEALQSQGIDVISVDWQPPAGGKQHLIDILNRLGA